MCWVLLRLRQMKVCVTRPVCCSVIKRLDPFRSCFTLPSVQWCLTILFLFPFSYRSFRKPSSSPLISLSSFSFIAFFPWYSPSLSDFLSVCLVASFVSVSWSTNVFVPACQSVERQTYFTNDDGHAERIKNKKRDKLEKFYQVSKGSFNGILICSYLPFTCILTQEAGNEQESLYSVFKLYLNKQVFVMSLTWK